MTIINCLIIGNYKTLFFYMGQILYAVLTIISLTTLPSILLAFGCGRKSLILTSLPLMFPCLFVDSTISIFFPGSVWFCYLLTAPCCFAPPALFVSFVLAISCSLRCRRLNERNCQLFLRIWFLHYLFRFLPGWFFWFSRLVYWKNHPLNCLQNLD